MEAEFTDRRIRLEGSFNTRELGGYTGSDGKKTKNGQFLRSDGLDRLTEADKKILRDYGIRAIVDLRSKAERQEKSGAQEDGFVYYSVPMLDNIQSSGFDISRFPSSLAELYIGMLQESKEEITQVMKIFAQYETEGVLFHCTAGKDRTGVISMLLLLLAGVDEDVAAQDYSLSEGYIRPLFENQRRKLAQYGVEIPEFIFGSAKEEMERTIGWLKEQYGSAENYLSGLGLEAETEIIRRKLLEENIR